MHEEEKGSELDLGPAQTFPFRCFFLWGNDVLETAKRALDNKLETKNGEETDQRLNRRIS